MPPERPGVLFAHKSYCKSKGAPVKKSVIVVAAIAAFGFVNVASAADMPVKAPIAAPAAVYNWTGFYLGINGGGGWTKSQEGLAAGPLSGISGINTATCGLASPAGDCQHNLSGILGGGQLGYNWQSANWVYGLEGLFDAANINGTTNGSTTINVYTTKVTSLLLLTGRLGYAWNQWLVYGKGGYAGGSVRLIVTSDTDNIDSTRWHNGWTIGGGVEYGLMRNWILGAEYDYVALGNTGRTVVGSGGADTVNVNMRGMHVLLGRLSYKF